MALQSSGQISFSDIFTEIYKVAPGSNSNISIYTLSGYASLSTAPYTLAEFYNYSSVGIITLNLTNFEYGYASETCNGFVYLKNSVGTTVDSYYVDFEAVGSGFITFNFTSLSDIAYYIDLSGIQLRENGSLIDIGIDAMLSTPYGTGTWNSMVTTVPTSGTFTMSSSDATIDIEIYLS